MKSILTFTLRDSLGDCTNNGLTSKQDKLELFFNVNDSDINNLPDDALVLIKKSFMGKPFYFAKPVSLVKSDRHSMFGGNFIYTSDSRFPFDAPIKVHDRVEY